MHQSAQLLHPGAVIAGFRLEELVDQGGYGLLYRARDPQGDPVALKILQPEHAKREVEVKDFEREADFLQNIQGHPAIPGYHSSGRDEDTGLRYIAMEWIEGQTLAAYMDEQDPIPIADAVEIVLLILDALSHIHAKGLHRDFTPRNVMIVVVEDDRRAANMTRFVVKLVDFGRSKLMVDRVARVSATMQPNFFHPPELARQGAEATAASDLYSAAAIFYALLAGPGSWTDEGSVGPYSTVVRGRGHIADEIEKPPIRDIRPDVPRPLAAVIHKGLRRNQARRYQSATAMREAIEAALKPRSGLSSSALHRLIEALLPVVAVALSLTVDLRQRVPIPLILASLVLAPILGFALSRLFRPRLVFLALYFVGAHAAAFVAFSNDQLRLSETIFFGNLWFSWLLALVNACFAVIDRER